MRIKNNPSEIIFDRFNEMLMAFLILITLYPLLYVLFASVSDPTALSSHIGLLLKPIGFSLDAYGMVFKHPKILTGYMNTIFYVFVGTSANLLFTIMLAYGLSRKQIQLRNAIMFFIVFTMFFRGGIIPTYLMVRDLGLLNTRWALIYSGLINSMNLIIMRTSFAGIPDSIEESAKIDGANDVSILFKIIVPLSMPIISVMILFYGVGHWNAWFNASIYLRKAELHPLQLVLREILLFSQTQEMMLDSSTLGTKKGQDMSEVIKYATIIVATVPILLVYPFLQKYFVKGVMVGAIKG